MDHTEQLILDEGYAAVSYRRVAKVSGVSTSVVQYHFSSIDELFVAVLRRGVGSFLEDMANEIQANPTRALHIIWGFNHDLSTTALHLEYLALTNHRDRIRIEMEQLGHIARQVQLDALTERLKQLDFDTEDISPDALLFVLIGIPQMMLFDRAIGLSTGHTHITGLAERYLDRLEPTSEGNNSPDLAVRARRPRRI